MTNPRFRPVPGALEGLAVTDKREKRDHEIAWQDWDEAAFSKAGREGKLVLLDITATWCHWCHVMDETSYSQADNISFINENFVPVRVDGDKRPDIQDRYLANGWPTTALLLPTGEALASEGYIRPEGLKHWLSTVLDYYHKNRDQLKEEVEKFNQEHKVLAESRKTPADALDPNIVNSVVSTMVKNFDEENGGFGGAPKFPFPEVITFLLYWHQRSGEERYLDMARKTLKSQLGIYDDVWGGFYRYSVNASWTIPHFEKLLDANAHIIENYLDLWFITKDDLYLDVAKGTLLYLKGFLKDDDWGWYGSQDADVGSHDGSMDFIPGENYFHLDDAKRLELGIPYVDRTRYTGANASAASASLRASVYLKSAVLQDFALHTLDKLYETNYIEGTLFHYEDHLRAAKDLLSDYIELARAMKRTYEITADSKYFERGLSLLNGAIDKLLPRNCGGFIHSPYLVVNGKRKYQMLRPLRENFAMAELLLQYYQLTEDERFRKLAEDNLRFFSASVVQAGVLGAGFAQALDEYANPGPRAVLVGEKGSGEFESLKYKALTQLPLGSTVRYLDPRSDELRLGSLTFPDKGVPLLYICVGNRCSNQISDTDNFEEKLDSFLRPNSGGIH